MASIKKRPNGSYQATIYAGRDADGKQLFRYVTKPGLKECKAAAREIEQELEENNYINLGKFRFNVWLEKWLELNKSRLSPSTYALYKSYEKNHFKPFFGKFKLSQITELHFKEFVNEKLSILSQSSVRRMTSTLKQILEDALKHKSPAKAIKLPSEEKYSPAVLTDKQFIQIHEAVTGTRDEPIILLAAWCGLRRGEIFALKWNDVDWNNGTVRVDESYCLTNDNLYIDKRPKSENGIREIVVPEYLLNLLEELKKKQFGVVDNAKKEKENKEYRIFNMRPDSYSSYFAELIRDKHLPKIRFHDLRHYHASWLYAQGIPDHYAAQRLGHDIQILKSIYQHLGLDKKVEIDNNIRNLYNK